MGDLRVSDMASVPGWDELEARRGRRGRGQRRLGANPGAQYIAAGSDDGNLFIWDRWSTNLVKVLHADDNIVNCVQAHPSTCLLATSGIDPVVRLWSPQSIDVVCERLLMLVMHSMRSQIIFRLSYP